MSAPMPLEIWSDDIDDVRDAISEWEEQCAIDEGALDYSYRVLLALEVRLYELETGNSLAERREQRSDYWRSVI